MVPKSRKIRVAIIRCDLHALWYAGLFAKHDPVLFRKRSNICHYYFYNKNNPLKLAIPTVSGLALVKVWDQDKTNAEEFARIFSPKPLVCLSLDEACEDVDMVFLADSNTDGSCHLSLAMPSLKKGLPTFVDKPLSSNLKDAKEIVRLAKRHKAPLMSASLLSQVPEGQQLRSRFSEIEPIEFAIIRNPGIGLDGRIHGISFAQNLFGPGVEWVESMGPNPLEYLHLHYPKSHRCLDVLICHTRTPHCGLYCTIHSKRGLIHSPRIDDWRFIGGGVRILNLLKKMVRTRKPPISYESMLELIKIVEAGKSAQKKGKRVRLKEVK
ncbi:MAG: Gfo/Idh/MocA family oxidoreductase [Planctomycetota bacterium]